MKVIGKRKCCWSRSAPIVYTRQRIGCNVNELPEVFHGSQWVSLHRSLVYHAVQHPTAQRVVSAFEHTLLPDEALLQTIAVKYARAADPRALSHPLSRPRAHARTLTYTHALTRQPT